MKTISVIGLGYVGLPLALLCAEKGLEVYGIDIDTKKINLLQQGMSHIDDNELKKKVKSMKNKIKFTSNPTKPCDVVIICVPTPIDKEYLPDLKPLKEACKETAKHIKDNALIVIESTIFPGTIEEIVLPILSSSNKKFYLAHCPERIDPGNKKYNISNLPRVVAGIDKKSTEKASEFYRRIIDAEIIELSAVKAAEATKIMENTFRDINIAFVNEMAKSFDKAGIDIKEVIKGASSKPFAFMPHYPGAGVGGHCIKIDPYYLIEKAKQLGFNHRFVSLAREINESMPKYVVELLENELQKLGKIIKGAKIGILGLAYKANVDDIRESPSLVIIDILKEKDSELFIYDPFIKKDSNVEDLNELLNKSDYIILVTDHKEFLDMDLNLFKKNNIRIIIDGRNCLDKEDIKKLGIAYHGIGRS